MKISSFFMLLSVVLLWGSSFTLIKIVLEEMQPLTLAFLRFLLVSPLLILLSYSRRSFTADFRREIGQNWKLFSLLGLAGVTLYHVLQNLGLKLTTASNASVLIASNPVFIALFSFLLLREQVNWKRGLGIILAFFGMLVVIASSNAASLRFSPEGLTGDFLSLGAALSWAIYSVLGKKSLVKCSADKVSAGSILFGTLFLFPLIIVFERPTMPSSLSAWIIVLILSYLCSGLAYLLWYKALENEQAAQAGVFLFFIPVVSVSIAHLILSETLTSLFIAGALLTLIGVAITQSS